jgi:hypothetical protein
VFDNSFTFWLVSFGISAAWLVGSIVTGNYFLAVGGAIYLAIMILIELPGTSSEEGTGDNDPTDPDSGIE